MHRACRLILPDCDCIVLLCSTEMGKTGKGAQYKFMIVQPNGKWMQEISNLIEQVTFSWEDVWEQEVSVVLLPAVIKVLLTIG